MKCASHKTKDATVCPFIDFFFAEAKLNAKMLNFTFSSIEFDEIKKNNFKLHDNS
jgi:hypothetical protein